MIILELTGDLEKCMHLTSVFLAFLDMELHASTPQGLASWMQCRQALPASDGAVGKENRGCLWQVWLMILRLSPKHLFIIVQYSEQRSSASNMNPSQHTQVPGLTAACLD